MDGTAPILIAMTLPPTDPIRVRVVRDLAGFEALAATWSALHARTEADSPFLHHLWLSSWCRIFLEPGDELRIVVLSRGDDTIAIAPFYVRSQPALSGWPRRVLRLLGTGEPEADEVCSELLDILCLPGDAREVSGVIADHLDQGDPGWDTLALVHILESSCLNQFLVPALVHRGHTVTTAPEMNDYYTDLPASHDEYVRSMKKSRRETYRRNHNVHLKLDGTYEVIDRRDQVLPFLDEIVRLHRARWSAAGRAGTFATPRNLAFHRHFLPRAHDAGLLCLTRVRYGDRCASTHYDLTWRGVRSTYQAGVDTQMLTHSAGTLHIELSIQHAIQAGARRYDLLGSVPGTYKDRMSISMRPLLAEVVYNRRTGGRLALLQTRARAGARHFRARFRSAVRTAS